MKKLIFLCLAIALLCCGCNEIKVKEEKTGSESFKTVSIYGYGYVVTNICQKGYEYVIIIGRSASITQVFELVDGVTRPKMCEEVK